MSVNEKMTAIADAIRAKTGGTDALSLDGMAAEIPDVYAAGQQSEYDAFWDAYQDNGNRTDYEAAFSGTGWTSKNFKPKYDMAIGRGYTMFTRNTVITNTEDMPNNVKLDMSNMTSASYIFAESSIEHIGTISSTNSYYSAFVNCYRLVTIEKLIIPDTISSSSSYWKEAFDNAKKLESLTIEGTIERNGFNVRWSPLSHDSLISIVNALSADTTGLTVTLSKSSVNKAFETSVGAADGSTSDEWATLIATKPNWTFTLA